MHFVRQGTQPNPVRALRYFFFDLAFFFMTLFLRLALYPIERMASAR